MLQVHVIRQHKTRHKLHVQVVIQHIPEIYYMYTSSVNINQTYATGTSRQSKLTRHKLYVHVISQHTPDI